MIVRKLRLKKGWSQSQLAEMAGVTTRTIQRIEQGHRPSMETCKALASVFEVDLSLFQPEDEQMQNETELKMDEQRALLYAKRMKEFYEFLITYVVMAVVFLFVFHGEPVVYIIFAGLLPVIRRRNCFTCPGHLDRIAKDWPRTAPSTGAA